MKTGTDSVYYMGMLEGRWEFTWVYLPPGREPQ
jgi:hypothetical protein